VKTRRKGAASGQRVLDSLLSFRRLGNYKKHCSQICLDHRVVTLLILYLRSSRTPLGNNMAFLAFCNHLSSGLTGCRVEPQPAPADQRDLLAVSRTRHYQGRDDRLLGRDRSDRRRCMSQEEETAPAKIRKRARPWLGGHIALSHTHT